MGEIINLDDVRNGWTCKEHRYKVIERDYIYGVELIPMVVYRCSQCGKIKTERDYSDEDWYTEENDDYDDNNDDLVLAYYDNKTGEAVYLPYLGEEEERKETNPFATNVMIDDSDLPF